MMNLVNALTKPSRVKKYDDDFVDRLSNRYTIAVLVTFAAVVGMYNYTGKPITCWAPKHFTGGWTKYTNNYCWVKNTYYLPFEDHIPKEHEEKRHILYYQWVPFILLTQAMFFYAPSIVWHALNQKGGIDVDNILRAACALDATKDATKRQRMTGIITNLTDRFLVMRGDYMMERHGARKAFDIILCKWIGRRLNGYMVLLFLVTKALYFLNVIMQLYALTAVLQTKYSTFGFDFLNDVENEEYFENSPIFPKMSMCDFRIRNLGNVQRYTVQCVLPINLYTEKIYAMLYFWMLFVAVMTVASFVVWSVRSMFWTERHKFIINHIPLRDHELKTFSGRLATEDFVQNYLNQDGAFLMRMIAHNTNNLTTSDLITDLFQHYKENVMNKPPRLLDDDNHDDDTDDSISKERI